MSGGLQRRDGLPRHVGRPSSLTRLLVALQSREGSSYGELRAERGICRELDAQDTLGGSVYDPEATLTLEVAPQGSIGIVDGSLEI